MTDKDPARLCPDARLSRPTKLRDGRAIVDIDTYVPYFLSSVSNAMSRGASQIYLDRFGIGIVDWRVISMLAIEPWIPASRICTVVQLDKGATSRSLVKLVETGFLDHEASEQDARRKTYALNDKGYALHDEILAIALERERALIQGVEPEDLEAFLRVMRVMKGNLRYVE
ncbi:MarR family winged helix-turn-helix transcriptional regulator [Pararhodobacter aggregans]|uniref:MarR family transcriptional regulator n=1 Tax=Pararhodobacter aggregans TaxID=404875 RepID=A0A2T7UX66_9RHOB|nr:MarR family winged helix-turn-helix transcriptional regulator [Pararhodobacter aggregans]PTX04831.1 DNA-binding MarR family transcriptional regulator [Pararhodobacter aggregans]PVE49161.1 MarR family transcriptional regulator [Pararhodobacter aggregans]